jgi:hypothetical protein
MKNFEGDTDLLLVKGKILKNYMSCPSRKLPLEEAPTLYINKDFFLF